MKKLKFLISGLVLVIVILIGQINVFASTPVAILSEPKSLIITRNVKNVTNPVTNTFSYTVTADESNPENGATGIPTSLQIIFNNIAPDAITHIATQTGVLDFTNATFSKVGDYKFLVEETSSTDSLTYPVSNDKYYVYIQVRNELDSSNIPTGNLVATLVSQANLTTNPTEKTDIVFPAESNFTHVILKNNVTGNMADPDEYFKFKIDIDGNIGDQYVISGQDNTVNYNGTEITTNSIYTVGEDNYVYLKSGQTVTVGFTADGINQIKVETEYQITEEDAITYIDGSTEPSKISNVKLTDSNSANNITNFVNNKEEQSLTGLFINIAPYVLIVVIAIIGIITVMKFSKNNKEI